MFNWTCPRCSKEQLYPTIVAASLSQKGRNGKAGCQSCRLAMTFDDNKVSPVTVAAIIEYMDRTTSWPDAWR